MTTNDKRTEVKQLISRGQEKGYLTYEEIHDVLPSNVGIVRADRRFDVALWRAGY